MGTKFRFGIVLALVASMFSAVAVTSAHDHDTDDHNNDYEIANDSFYNVWNRTDRPVADGKVHRTWIWGPSANSPLLEEDYVEGDNGTRYVQYFDKSRMEMPTGDHHADEKSAWHITQGRLAYELMSGNIQLGDHEYYENGPSQRSAAGDQNDTTAPTYAVMGELVDAHPRETGGVITQFVDRHGNLSDDYDYKHYGVTDYKYDAVTDHNIASVFWKFMNSTGVVYGDGYHKAKSDHLFENPYYAVGRPLTEAYWARVTVGGVEQNVLIQAFERRVLTYTPDNPKGWEVESGNIGQHYYDWRYIEKGDVDNGDNGDVDNGDNGDIADGGDFTVDGATTIDIGIGATETATATVTLDGSGPEGVTVIVELDDGSLVSLDNLTGTTDANGEASFAITGLLAGTATLNAYADLDGSGDFDASVDIDLGNITVNVGDNGTGDNGDNGTGVDAPDSLGIGITGQVNTLGNQVTVDVALDNSSDWEGSVDLELECDGDQVDTGVVNIEANASASAQLSHSSDDLASIGVCTVTALINGQVVASDTVAIVDLLP